MEQRLTRSRIRLRCISQGVGDKSLVMIPGGPGMGSDYLIGLAHSLSLPQDIWLVDFVGNGDHLTHQFDPAAEDYRHWSALIGEIAETLNTLPVLLGHSFGGMLLQDDINVQTHCSALILLATLPQTLINLTEDSRYESALQAQLTAYLASPSDEALKSMVIALAPWYFAPHEYAAGLAMLESCHYSHRVYNHFLKEYRPGFKAAYVPEVETLILSGSDDPVTPVQGFLQDPAYQQRGIQIEAIPNASHFPWINQPVATAQAIEGFCARL